MNRLLKELAEQAGYPDHMTYGQDLVLERFAELIVRECCDVFVELRTRPADLAVKDVKKHFGVDN